MQSRFGDAVELAEPFDQPHVAALNGRAAAAVAHRGATWIRQDDPKYRRKPPFRSECLARVGTLLTLGGTAQTLVRIR